MDALVINLPFPTQEGMWNGEKHDEQFELLLQDRAIIHLLSLSHDYW